MKTSLMIYLFWFCLVASSFGYLGYALFPDIAMSAPPWAFVSFFIFPFAYVLNSKKDLDSLEEVENITPSELSRLKDKISFSKRFLLLLAMITVLFAVLTGVILYYSVVSEYSIKYSTSFIMAMIGANLYLVYSLWHLNDSISSFKSNVANRASQMKRQRHLQDRLLKKKKE